MRNLLKIGIKNRYLKQVRFIFNKLSKKFNATSVSSRFYYFLLDLSKKSDFTIKTLFVFYKCSFEFNISIDN